MSGTIVPIGGDDPYRTPAERPDNCTWFGRARPRKTAARLLIEAGAFSFASKRMPCPKCQMMPHFYNEGSSLNAGPQVTGKICTGGFWKSCPRVEHFHVECASCGAKWIVAPADVEMP